MRLTHVGRLYNVLEPHTSYCEPVPDVVLQSQAGRGPDPHIRSDVADSVTHSLWSSSHTVAGTHTRSVVAVASYNMYWLYTSHVEMLLHTRLRPPAHGRLWYWYGNGLQKSQGAHVSSVDGPPLTVYRPEAHTVRGEHTWSEVGVFGADSYCCAVHGAEYGVHTLSDVNVGALGWY